MSYDLCPEPSGVRMEEEESFGEASAIAAPMPSTFGKQSDSRVRNTQGNMFSKEEAPALYGRNALSLGGLSPALGTQSMGSCNDDEHKFTRPHCFDVRDYGSTLGISGHSSRENLSTCKEPPAWSFSPPKKTRRRAGESPGRPVFEGAHDRSNGCTGTSVGPGQYHSEAVSPSFGKKGAAIVRSRVDGGRSFGKEEAPALYGRNALSLGGMSPALGTQSMGSCNDDEHKFTRPHCFDVRDYGSTLGISGHSSRENLSNCKEPPAWSFSKSKRKSNVASWRGLR